MRPLCTHTSQRAVYAPPGAQYICTTLTLHLHGERRMVLSSFVTRSLPAPGAGIVTQHAVSTASVPTAPYDRRQRSRLGVAPGSTARRGRAGFGAVRRAKLHGVHAGAPYRAPRRSGLLRP